MKTEIGEYIVGAYLQLVLKCDIVCYNTRLMKDGISGLGELDVIGLRFCNYTAFLCEVTTHLNGLLYKNYETTTKKIKEKHEKQKKYAEEHLKLFNNKIFQLWSPVVGSGLVKKLQELIGVEKLELIINQKYTERINELMKLGKTTTKDFGNPFFRTLQILGHIKKN